MDSRSITAGLGVLVTLAAEAAAEGASAGEVVAVVEGSRDRIHVIGGLDTLENLKKGGRIGGAQAMLGTLLSIKPVIDISTGSVEETGKVRTRRKQMLFIRDQIVAAGKIDNLVICDGGAPDAEEFRVRGRRGHRPRGRARHHRPGHRHPRRAADDRRGLARRRVAPRPAPLVTIQRRRAHRGAP